MAVLRIHARDNVAVALSPVAAGERVRVEGREVTALEDIPQGHKLALAPIAAGGEVIKYGCPSGRAKRDIAPGAWVHSHNLGTALEEGKTPGAQVTALTLEPMPVRTFRGYRRRDRGVGIRNEIWIIPTVGCVNGVAQALARVVETYARGRVDGVYAWPHPYGCSQIGEDQEATRRILCGLIRHPNAGGVLVLGLGCENSSISVLQELLGGWDSARTAFLECQAAQDELAEGEALLRGLIDRAAGQTREEIGVDELIVGLKCGGSDGLSGITANPLVGRVADGLVAMGGTALLAEIPEMFGAEAVLFRRCADGDTARSLPALVEECKDYFVRHGQVIYENPSPGNKAGGITTLEEKSLGCVQKGGSSPVRDVLHYGERAKKRGLCILQTPGNDLVSTTGLAASGAQLILFTTGRGTPFGAPVPTVKISTNTALAGHKAGWIDYSAGGLAQGEGWDKHTEALLRKVLDTASGAPTRSEQAGYRDLAIWKDGVTL